MMSNKTFDRFLFFALFFMADAFFGNLYEEIVLGAKFDQRLRCCQLIIIILMHLESSLLFLPMTQWRTVGCHPLLHI